MARSNPGSPESQGLIGHPKRKGDGQTRVSSRADMEFLAANQRQRSNV
jgi:hypothetical protein